MWVFSCETWVHDSSRLSHASLQKSGRSPMKTNNRLISTWLSGRRLSAGTDVPLQLLQLEVHIRPYPTRLYNLQDREGWILMCKRRDCWSMSSQVKRIQKASDQQAFWTSKPRHLHHLQVSPADDHLLCQQKWERGTLARVEPNEKSAENKWISQIGLAEILCVDMFCLSWFSCLKEQVL